MIASIPITHPKSFAMASRKRKFSDEQKLEILRQANEMGVITVIRNHNLSYSVFSRWREKFMKNDKSKQELVSRNKAKSEFKQIMEENSQLKRIIVDQALELKRKDEELRKNNQLYGKR
jgi:putative transposase